MQTEDEIEEISITIEKLYIGLRSGGFTKPAHLASHINTILISEGVPIYLLQKAWDKFADSKMGQMGRNHEYK